MQLKNLLPAALAVAAASAQNDTSSMNLTSLISSNSNLTGLATLLQSYPNVATSLSNATNVTLFAPSNDALRTVLSVLGSSNGDTSTLVQSIVNYHTLKGMYYASNISSTPQFPHSMLNNTMYSNVTGGQVVECRLEGMTAEIIGGLKQVANVTQANLNFTGGVVHVIDSVLQVPSNFSSVAQNANLTALLGATTATNLSSTLDNAHDITIFAPSNSAFQDIASAVGNLTAMEAASILEYHVINGTIAYSSSLTNTTLPTLNGKNVTISISNGTVFVNSARVVNADILLSGGVMHVIDSVLNPNNTNVTGNARETAAATAFSGASSATNVPYTSGVPTPTTTIVDLITSTTQVAVSYTSVVPAGGSSATGAAGGSGGSSSSSGIAAAPTGAMGAAALFGGAAFLANL